MLLRELGWNRYFSQQFKKYKEQNYLPARIISEQKKSYLLFCQKGQLKASARGIFWHDHNEFREKPVVGDWVAVELLSDKNSATIKTILTRKNQISRKSAGTRKKLIAKDAIEQIIAANIDLVFIVVGLDRDYNLRRIERYLTLAQKSGAKAVVILNKSDLCKDAGKKVNEVQKIAPNIPVLSMIALKKSDMKKIDPFIKVGKTAVLIGSSGVGKSTIINQMLGFSRQKITGINPQIGKGKHTTSRRELIILPNKGLIIDNPGMREIQLWAEKDDLVDVFSDIENYAVDCRFRNCFHENEPGCAVKQALEQGKIDRERFNNYQKLKKELMLLSRKKKGY